MKISMGITLFILISAVAVTAPFQLMLHLIGVLLSSLFMLHMVMEAHWKIYFILLVYLGGLFILFLYMASTWLGKVLYLNVSVILLVGGVLVLSTSMAMFNSAGNVELMGFTLVLTEWFLLQMLIMLSYLLILLILISFITSTLNQPMRML